MKYTNRIVVGVFIRIFNSEGITNGKKLITNKGFTDKKFLSVWLGEGGLSIEST